MARRRGATSARSRAQRRAAAARPVGRAGSRTASASRSRTTTAAIAQDGLGEPPQPAVRVAHPAQGRVRRLRARRRRLPRLDDHRRAPLHDAPRPAAGQHRGARSTTTRSPTSARSRTLQRPRAARARPARAPDGAARGRARASRASRGTRRSTWSPSGSARPRPTASALYLTARGITNEVYYVAQKAARCDRHQQRRQRGPRVPRAVDDRAQGSRSASPRRRARTAT